MYLQYNGWGRIKIGRKGGRGREGGVIFPPLKVNPFS